MYYSLGNTTFAEGLIRDILDVWVYKSGFCDFALMQVYGEWHSEMSEELRAGVKAHMMNRTLDLYVSYPGATTLDTPNQFLMRATAAHLAGQYWDHPNAKNGTDYLNEVFDTYTREGMAEFDSTTYHALYGTAFLLLAECSEDPVIQKKAVILLDWLYLTTATEWLDGWWISTTFRSYVMNESPEASAAGILSAWLFLGNSVRVPNMHSGYTIGHVEADLSLPIAYTRTMVADVIPHIAGLKPVGPSETRLVRESHYACKAFADPKAWGCKWVWKTSFFTEDYGVASHMTEPGIGEHILPHANRNQSNWLVRWPSSDATGGTTLFVQQRSDRNPDASTDNPYTPNEQVLQHEGAMVAVYDIRWGLTDVDAMIPKLGQQSKNGQSDVVEKKGWIFLQRENMFVALHFARGYRWTVPANPIINGVPYAIATSSGTQNAAVILTSRKTEYASLDAFSTAVLETAEVSFDSTGRKPVAVLKDLKGNYLVIEHDGQRKINGEEVDYKSWPIMETVQNGATWVSQPANTKIVNINVPGMPPCVYDYTNWTTTCKRSSISRSGNRSKSDGETDIEIM